MLPTLTDFFHVAMLHGYERYKILQQGTDSEYGVCKPCSAVERGYYRLVVADDDLIEIPSYIIQIAETGVFQASKLVTPVKLSDLDEQKLHKLFTDSDERIIDLTRRHSEVEQTVAIEEINKSSQILVELVNQ